MPGSHATRHSRRSSRPVMYAAYATRRASSGLTVGESAAIRVLKEGSSADHITNSSPRRPCPHGEESAITSNGTSANVLTPNRRERWKNILRSHTYRPEQRNRFIRLPQRGKWKWGANRGQSGPALTDPVFSLSLLPKENNFSGENPCHSGPAFGERSAARAGRRRSSAGRSYSSGAFVCCMRGTPRGS
jgi:hypothetical protein